MFWNGKGWELTGANIEQKGLNACAHEALCVTLQAQLLAARMTSYHPVDGEQLCLKVGLLLVTADLPLVGAGGRRRIYGKRAWTDLPSWEIAKVRVQEATFNA
jgi:hypothetical protein